MATGAASQSIGTEDRERLELREEQLDVDTRQVKAGEVRVRKEVHTETKNIEVPVQREEVVIERTPVRGRAATEGVAGDLYVGAPGRWTRHRPHDGRR